MAKPSCHSPQQDFCTNMPPKINKDKLKSTQQTILTTMTTRSTDNSPNRVLSKDIFIDADQNVNRDLNAPDIQIIPPTEDTADKSPTPSEEALAEITKKALELSTSRHTILPRNLLDQHKETESAYVEGDPIRAGKVTSKNLLEFKITPYHEEEELPNFFNATNALHYFRVLRDMIFNWTKSKAHEKTLRDSLISDTTPPGLRIKKNLEVIQCSPQLKLKALQILGSAENRLVRAILVHYEQIIPDIEASIQEIYDGMMGVNPDEKRLIHLKLVAYKNSIMRQQRERDNNRNNRFPNAPRNQDRRSPNNTPRNSDNTDNTADEQQPSTSTQDPNGRDFPWEQKPQRQFQQRQRPRGRQAQRPAQGGGRGRRRDDNRLQI